MSQDPRASGATKSESSKKGVQKKERLNDGSQKEPKEDAPKPRKSEPSYQVAKRNSAGRYGTDDTDPVPGVPHPDPTEENTGTVGCFLRRVDRHEYGLVTTDLTSHRAVIESLAQRLSRMQMEVSDFLMSEESSVGRNDEQKQKIGESTEKQHEGALQESTRQLQLLMAQIQKGMEGYDLLLYETLMDQLRNLHGTNQDMDEAKKKEMPLSGTSQMGKDPLADTIVTAQALMKPCDDVWPEDVFKLDARLAVLEKRLGVFESEMCPFADHMSALERCEEMYRDLFRDHQRSTGTKNYEVTMRKMQTVLLGMRKFAEKLQVFGTEGQFDDQADFLYESLLQFQALAKRNILPILSRSLSRVFADPSKQMILARVTQCETRLAAASQQAAQIKNDLEKVSTHALGVFNSNEAFKKLVAK